MWITKSYRELSLLKTFQERFNYLRFSTNPIGVETFGFDRYLNQVIYKSYQWKKVRNLVIIRDQGCDLGIEGRDILDRIVVHHINSITAEDIENEEPKIFDMDNLICTSNETHLAIHFSDESLLIKEPIERRPGDTIPWR
jgi:hypothetical protein